MVELELTILPAIADDVSFKGILRKISYIILVDTMSQGIGLYWNPDYLLGHKSLEVSVLYSRVLTACQKFIDYQARGRTRYLLVFALFYLLSELELNRTPMTAPKPEQKLTDQNSDPWG